MADTLAQRLKELRLSKKEKGEAPTLSVRFDHLCQRLTLHRA